MAKVKDEYRLPNPLVYRLNNPNYTIYHRAALGGLASTITAWGNDQPEGITAKVERDEISFSWDGEKLSDQDFLRRLIEASFKLTDDKMIDLPGQRLDLAREDLRLAVHNGLRSVFLQHTQTYKAEGFAKIEFKTDDNNSLFFSYQKLKEYAHKNEKRLEFLQGNSLPEFSSMSQWMIPGVIAGAENIERPTDEIVLLMFLIVACPIFQVISQMPRVKREKRKEQKLQSCLVVPNVIDLIAFAKAISFINAQKQDLRKFSSNYSSRVVGGTEEAGLRFLLDLQVDDLLQRENRSVSDCSVIAMGKVAWVNSQVSRSLIAKVRGDYDEINVFTAARQYLGMSKTIKLENGDSFVVPSSPIPELIAANLANERHWCSNFIQLVKEKEDFEKTYRYMRGGLQKMNDEIKDLDDQIIIKVFQEAWKFTVRNLYDRAESRNSDESMDLDARRERIRNEILRRKTAEHLASWFLRFCADATKGNSLPSMQKNGEKVRKFIFNQRNFDRFQNLCLFALISYASEKKTTNPQQGESK